MQRVGSGAHPATAARFTTRTRPTVRASTGTIRTTVSLFRGGVREFGELRRATCAAGVGSRVVVGEPVFDA